MPDPQVLPAAPPPPQTTVHEAFRTHDGTGIVDYGTELDDSAAVARRQRGLDIVVRGPDKRANKRKACSLEMAVGTPVVLDVPHARAGSFALPHYHQSSRNPDGHSFYEVDRRKARKKP